MELRDAVRRHYRSKWGEPARQAEFRVAGLLAEILKWDASVTGEGVTLYTTVGASDRPIDADRADHRIEFFVGLRPERDEIASALAALALYPARENATVSHGHTIPSDAPFWKGTSMRHFLVLRPLQRIIEPFQFGEGIHVEFLQAIPIFESESSYKVKHGSAGLLDLWKERQVRFWDPERRAEPA